ncbi:MAG: N-6 DNA methylase [Rickettsiales bacterium]|nr:N-6 DNA methylase [Rickettsiales bacterium]
MEIQVKNNKIFAPIKNKWLVLTPEEKVRQKVVCKLVNYYGYSLEQMAQESQVSNSSNRGRGKARADIVIWKSKEEKLAQKVAFIVVECKAENVSIKEEDYFQGLNYATWAGASFFVTTNEKTNKFFRVNKTHIPNRLDEVIDIPKAEDVDNKSKIEKILSQTKTFTRDEFTKLLEKCHNIIRNNDKLDPAVAFDEISKILFMKIRYERNPDEDVLFSLDHFKQSESYYEKYMRSSEDNKTSYMQVLFKQTKDEFAKDDLFDKNDTIKIRQHSFEQIVKELEKYNLSDTSDDIKGIAFERFLGRTFRGELGQFFTPRPLVDFMVEILDPQEGETICDPCCGSGGFLIKAFEYVRDKIEVDIQKVKENIKEKYLSDKKNSNKVNNLIAKLNEDLNLKNPCGRLNQLSSKSIFGTDANPRMARTSKMNMIMHGDGHSGLHHNDGLLNVNGIFEDRFDVILTNPPFGARVDKNMKITESDKFNNPVKIQYYTEIYGEQYTKALKQVNDNINTPLLDLFDVGKLSGLTEVLFMERCLRLLKKGGRMGIVLPEGVLNNPNLQKIRDYFEGRAKILLITSIPQDVFVSAKATVKPSLLFLKKFTESEENEYRISSNESKTQVRTKYQTKIEEIENSELPKKDKNKKIKDIEAKIAEEIKTLIKSKLNYRIPIAEAKQAGITTTGESCNNDLIDIAKEFTDYRKANNLWLNPAQRKVSYDLNSNEIKKVEAC